jgi:hypothetical protein
MPASKSRRSCRSDVSKVDCLESYKLRPIGVDEIRPGDLVAVAINHGKTGRMRFSYFYVYDIEDMPSTTVKFFRMLSTTFEPPFVELETSEEQVKSLFTSCGCILRW